MSKVCIPAPKQANHVCGIDSFTAMLLDAYKDAQPIEVGGTVGPGDVLIVNHHGAVHCKNYCIDDDAKLIYIVHEVWRDMEIPLKEPNYCVYLNEWQQKVAEMMGVKTPFSVFDGHPIMGEICGDGDRDNAIYVGGWLKADKMDGLYSRLKRLLLEYPDAEIRCYFITNGLCYQENYDYFVGRVGLDPQFDGRIRIWNAEQFPFEGMKHNMRRCRYAYLWRNEPTFALAKELIEAKDDRILDIKVGASGMLANAITAGCELIVEPCLRFASHLDGIPPKTFGELVQLLRGVVDKIDECPNPTPVFKLLAIWYSYYGREVDVTQQVRDMVRENPRLGRINRNCMTLSCNQRKCFPNIVGKGKATRMRVVYRYGGKVREAGYDDGVTVNVPFSTHKVVETGARHAVVSLA